MSRLFDNVVIAGVGLIGGSLALAARQRGLFGGITGLGRSEANLRAACERGIIDRFSLDPVEAARGADLLFLAVPVGAMGAVAAACAPALREGATVTDAGSVKSSVIRDVEAALPAAISFVGAHPIAGGERAGAVAARADLFAGSPCVITPAARSTAPAVARVRRLWEGVGMRVIEMDAATHDALLARVSHLPHLLAFALAGALRGREHELVAVAGRSFRDVTRVAASPSQVWSDIFLANQAQLLTALEEFEAAFEELRRAVRGGDRSALQALIERARRVRARIVGSE